MPACLAPLLEGLVERLLHVDAVLERRAAELLLAQQATYARRLGTATKDEGEDARITQRQAPAHPL
jgi:hypothetical protein